MTVTSIPTLDSMEVRVAPFDSLQRGYPVTIELENGRTFNGVLQLDSLGAPPSDGDEGAIVAYGLDLFNRLFAGPLADAFHQAWAAADESQHGLRVRLWLDSTDPRLHAVPWELLHYDVSGQTSLSLPIAIDHRVAFSRYLASSESWGKPIERRPIRMLLVVSDPVDLETAWVDLVKVGKEAYEQDLKSRYQPLRRYGQIDYQFLNPASLENLHSAINRGYDVLLYFGHGLQHPTHGPHLLLEHHKTRKGELYDGKELVRLMKLARNRPSLVVLVACDTAAQPAQPAQSTQSAKSPGGRSTELLATTSLAAQLVQEGGVPAVLAMQRLVDVSLARVFSFYLSDQMLQHGVVDVAVNAARHRVFVPGSVGWSTPVLYMRSQYGRLFSSNARLEYALAILEDHRFSRWTGKDSDFIDLEVLDLSAGQDWSVLQTHPHDAPSTQDALQTLKQFVAQGQQGQLAPETPPPPPSPTGYAPDDELPNLAVLIGPPHSGLTVMLQRLAFDLADAACAPPNDDDESDNVKAILSGGQGFLSQPVALYVPLEGYEKQQTLIYRLPKLIMKAVSDVVPALTSDLESLFDILGTDAQTRPGTPRYVFLLDGLNNIPDAYRLDAAREIHELACYLPEQRVIVTCNQNFFPSRAFQQSRVMVIQPLNERMVLRYLQRRSPNGLELFRRIVENGLIRLTTEPALLSIIYNLMVRKEFATLTRNQLVKTYADQMLDKIPPNFLQGDVAHKTLKALSWYARWHHLDVLPLGVVFSILGQIREDRDYSLEAFFLALQEADLLVSVGNHGVRFIHPLVPSYFAALALIERPDWKDRLNDILVLCSVHTRLAWWEETIYALVELLNDTVPLFQNFSWITAHSHGPHAVLLARCMTVLPPTEEQRIPAYLRQELLDTCLVRMNPSREPWASNRAQIVSVLGNLSYIWSDTGSNDPLIIDERLIQLLTERVRVTPHGNYYEYTEVRIAAAQSLRTRYAMRQENGTTDDKQQAREASVYAYLEPLLQCWCHGQRDTLRATLTDSTRQFAERAIAAFALGYLAAGEEDAQLLLDCVVNPDVSLATVTAATARSAATGAETWGDLVWTAADALMLFDANLVARLLTTLLEQQQTFSIQSTRQVIYLAGRVRARDEVVVGWLVNQLRNNDSHVIKARALQSITWIGAALQSFDWLPNALRLVGLAEVWHEPGEAPHTLVHRVIKNVAAWDTGYLVAKGFMNEATDGEARDTIYLRRKAIRALAWVGDKRTIEELRPQALTWDLSLREAWYETVTTIESRIESRLRRGL